MSGGDFLSRWSKRKRAPVRPAPVPEAAPPREDRDDGVHHPLPDAEGDGDLLSPDELAKLPSLDSFTSETDLTQFLRAGVPLMLRKAALRRMWSVDTGIRDYVSEAREYAYDWNAVGGVPGSGPLLPTDDIKAMLRDIFDGTPAVEEAATQSAEPQRDADEADPAADRAYRDIASPAVADPGLTAAATGTETDASPPTPASVARSDLPPATRPRRHGGAMPL